MSGPGNAGPPPWFEEASFDVLQSAVCATIADDRKTGREWIVEAITRFADTCAENGGTDFDWLVLAGTLASVVVDHSPEWQATDGEYVGLEVADPVTGTRIADPDAEMESAADRGALAAMRMVAAQANGDQDTFRALFDAAGSDESGPAAVFTLAEMAGSCFIDAQRRKGELPAEALTTLAAREAVEAAEFPEVAVGPSRVTGRAEYWDLPMEDADKTPEAKALYAPHGPGIYATTVYLAGVNGAREKAIRTAHGEIEAGMMGRVSEPLCGIRHVEDIQSWQVPRSARRQLNRHLRDVKRRTGREPLVLRAWQHAGPCDGKVTTRG